MLYYDKIDISEGIDLDIKQMNQKGALFVTIRIF